jgi:anti-anti-sigma regulatory factor/HAMP domain-containing protein
MSWTIRTKLTVYIAAVAIASAGVTAWIGYDTAREALERQSFEKLTAVREMKANQVEDYFKQIRDQIASFAENRMIVQAMADFGSSFQTISDEWDTGSQPQDDVDTALRLYYEREFLERLKQATPLTQITALDFWPTSRNARIAQYRYIAASPFETGSKQLLDRSDDSTRYADIHATYHPIIRNFLERFGYYDIFLIDDTTGEVVYSVFKEVDFGTSLTAGPYRNSNFARAYKAALEGRSSNFNRMVDFEAYPPSYNAPASFIAAPIFNGNERLGVVVFQMPIDRINDIMTSRREWSSVGLGASGETYIVGDDSTLRNQSRFLIESRDEYLRAIRAGGLATSIVEAIDHLDNAIGLQEVRTAGTRAALGGETGSSVFPDYRGIPVLSAYKPLQIPDVRWVIMSEIDQAEAFAPVYSLRNQVLFWLAVLVVASLVVSTAFSKTLTRPVAALSRSAAELAGGDLDTPIENRARDEIGQLSRSFESMRLSLKKLVDKQARAIDALSTPLIPFQNDIMVMPLVGELDDRRIQRIRNELVEGLHTSGARAVIIDITGVPGLSPEAAEALTRAAQAVRLLGAGSVLTGMKPEVADALADLDLYLDGVVTRQSLQDGIEYAMQYTQGRRHPS